MKARQHENTNRLDREELKEKKQKLCHEAAEKFVWHKFERKYGMFETVYKQLMQKLYPSCDSCDTICTSFIDWIKKALRVIFALFLINLISQIRLSTCIKV